MFLTIAGWSNVCTLRCQVFKHSRAVAVCAPLPWPEKMVQPSMSIRTSVPVPLVISNINTEDAATVTPKVRAPGDSRPLPVQGWALLRSQSHPLLSKSWQNFPDASVLHFRDSERFISRLFPAIFIPLSGFSAFPSLLPLLTAIVGITKVAEQRASQPAATSAGQHLPWAAETNSSTPKTRMQTGCQQEAHYGSCTSPISTDGVQVLRWMKKESCPPQSSPFQCCLKQNVIVQILSIWIDKSGFEVSLFQDPAV